MNWDAIGALAEVFGAAAVLVTLIYLSLQIRQSNSLAEAQSQRELTTLDAFAPLVADPTLAAEFRACLNRYEEQDPEVKTRFFFSCRELPFANGICFSDEAKRSDRGTVL